jgi:hypothetical protein
MSLESLITTLQLIMSPGPASSIYARRRTLAWFPRKCFGRIGIIPHTVTEFLIRLPTSGFRDPEHDYVRSRCIPRMLL